MLTTSKNTHTNDLNKHVHQELDNILHTNKLEDAGLSDLDINEEVVIDTLWTVCSIFYTGQKSLPGEVLFSYPTLPIGTWLVKIDTHNGFITIVWRTE